MSYIELKNILKSFDDKVILKDINLDIEKEEFVTFLGPSGCGKTTLLRCLIGLETIDHGQILLDGKDITHVSAKDRGIGMVFQQYCLYPTMNVYDNVSFGLRMGKVDKKEIKERVYDMLAMVGLQDHVKKFPYQLSGGEQQRAALARGLIMNPKVLLLDEPFSAIDAKLRKELQIYLKHIHKSLHMTTVFVTHDQEEAMRMSDTIHLFNQGIVEQSASPFEIYSKPKSKYVAGFIGNYNIFSGNQAIGLIPECKELLSDGRTLAIRPELIMLASEPYRMDDDFYYISGVIQDQIPQGNILREEVLTTKGDILYVDRIFNADCVQKIGDTVYLKISKADVLIV